MVAVGPCASMGQQVRERYGDGLRGKAEGAQERELRDSGVGPERQRPHEADVMWWEGLLQAGCHRTD